eukprot:12815293-Prorocentrum_lima.AAC.1
MSVVGGRGLLPFKLHPENPNLNGSVADLACGSLDLGCLPADDPSPVMSWFRLTRPLPRWQGGRANWPTR